MYYDCSACALGSDFYSDQIYGLQISVQSADRESFGLGRNSWRSFNCVSSFDAPNSEWKDLLLEITYIVVLFSIVIQGLTVGKVAHRVLKDESDEANKEEMEDYLNSSKL